MKYCTEYAALLDLFVDGELDTAEMERVQAHLEDCPGCRAYMDDALLIRAAFPDVEDVEVPEGFAAGVMERIRADGKKNAEAQKSGRRWLRTLVPLAACCTLVVLLSNGPKLFSGGGENGVNMSGSSSGADTGAGEPAEYAAPAGAPQETEAASEETVDGTPGLAAARGYAADIEQGQQNMLASTPAEFGEIESEAVYDDGMETIPVLTMTAQEAGELLNDWTLERETDGVRRYVLTAEQYGTLLAALAEDEDGAYAKVDRTESPDGTIIVEVTGPF
ncbi:MAG: hypothetical protein HFF87_04565 [Oscillibacter sp.]|nr:hypothetical protein [Oscillibacter sp.]MCI9481931.1 hypothetical protein [Oscillibacter sp.]